MTRDWLLISLGLLAGTYLVRALPFWFSGIESLPAPIQRFLRVVPAAALGALIFPDAFIGFPAVIAAGVVVLAFLLTLRRVGLTVVVILTIALAWASIGLIPAG